MKPVNIPHNQLLTLILIMGCYFQLFSSFSQSTITEIETQNLKKNSIKGIGYVFGNAFNGGFAGFSIGYERQISRHSVLELTGYYYHQLVDEMGATANAFCVMTGYKYLVTSNRKFINNTWFSIYLTYYKKTNYPNSDSESEPSIDYLNGIGGSIGKKIFFAKNWFLEVGIGASYNLFNIEPKSSHSSQSFYIVPRPILQLGGRF
jgi:hypothetical protein